MVHCREENEPDLIASFEAAVRKRGHEERQTKQRFGRKLKNESDNRGFQGLDFLETIKITATKLGLSEHQVRKIFKESRAECLWDRRNDDKVNLQEYRNIIDAVRGQVTFQEFENWFKERTGDAEAEIPVLPEYMVRRLRTCVVSQWLCTSCCSVLMCAL